jgi:signal transduction histidine kinase
MVRIYPELITAEGAMMLSALFPILLAYAVIKKNLFDMDFVLRTTTIYAVATVMVVALYFAVVFVIGLAMSAWTRRYMGFLQNVETVVISTLVVALIFHPLRLGVQRVIDRYFFRAQSVLQEELSRLGKELAAMTTHFPSLAQHLTEHVQKLMRSRYVVLLSQSSSRRVFHNVAKAGTIPTALEGLAIPAEHPMIQFLSEHNELLLQWEPNDRWLKSDIADLLISAEFTILVPLRTATTLAGVLILGRRQQGDVFNRFDLNALRSMALPAALALENSLLLREHAERERLAALRKFSAVMIHEIKNPLRIIRVSSGTLKKRFDPSDSGYELSSFIEEEVVRMNQTIAQFLTFARPSQPKLTRIELAELVRRTASAMQENLKEAGIQLELEIDSPMPVMADGDQVQQVLLNLLVNARQALEEREGGKVAITLRRLPVKSSPLMAELKVKDNGSGIDPSIMDRIFEPFFTTRRGGTGLGLAIARQLLNEQGGRIEVRSEAIGTEFTVTLPAIQVTAPSSSS